MGLIRDASRSTRGRIVIGAIAAIVLWKLALAAIAPTKIAHGIEANVRGRVNVRITLTVVPERFHVLAFQQFGRVSGTQDRSVDVRNVAASDLASLARPYWVRRVEPLPGVGTQPPRPG